MKRGPKVGIAVALGLLAAFFGLAYLTSEKTRVLGNMTLAEVYVASENIHANTVVDARKLTTKKIPTAYLQPGAIRVSEVTDPTKTLGVAIVPIAVNEQIDRTKLWQGKTPPLSEDLKTHPGLVGVSVLFKDPPQALQGLVQAPDLGAVLAS